MTTASQETPQPDSALVFPSSFSDTLISTTDAKLTDLGSSHTLGSVLPYRRRSTDNEVILIVDDSPEYLSELGDILQSSGYRVKVANSVTPRCIFPHASPRRR